MQDTKSELPAIRPDAVYLESATGTYRRWDAPSRAWVEATEAVALELQRRHVVALDLKTHRTAPIG